MEDAHYLCDRSGNKKYVRRRLLGTGGFAKCFEVQSLSEDKQIYAAKVIPKKNINEKKQRYKLILQIKLHRSLSHEGIVGFKDVFEDSENIYIVLQYCKFNTLKELVKRRKRLTEYETRVYTIQMINAMMYIHSKNIVHRDLKLGNVLINQHMQTKICDFGLSTRIRETGEKRKTVCGTPNYIAPEILEEQGHSYEVDVWSLGVIIYTLLVGKPPYEDQSVDSTYQNIKNNRYSFPDIGISEQAIDLVERILVLEPDRRLTLEDILNHEFLQPFQKAIPSLPRYTIAIPPQKERKGEIHHLIAPDEISNEQAQDQVPQRSLTIDRSIIIKQVQNDQSHSIDEIQFSISKRREKLPTDCGYIVYIREAIVSQKDVGFLLSNGIMGIYFTNDRTSIILEYDEKYFVYIEKADSEKYTTVKYNVGILDESVKKKYQKFTYFLAFFKMKYFNDQFEQMRKRYRQRELELIFIKKVMVLEHQILMRLSNGIVELQLADLSHAFLLLNTPAHLFYINKAGNQSVVQQDSLTTLKNRNLASKLKRFRNYMDQFKIKTRHVAEFRLSIE